MALRDRIEFVREAADTLRDTGAILRLAVEAMSDACGRGVAVAFTREARDFTVMAEGELLPQESKASHPGWIVDIDCVPAWQQNRWIEPMQAGIHGPDYFSPSHPLARVFRSHIPDYGRTMICAEGRLVAWAGVFVDARRPFSDHERTRLGESCASLAEPLRVSALLSREEWTSTLSVRQNQILARVSRGWTNKQIAKDLDISAATVKTLLERLYRRSGCGNRIALAAWMRRLG